MNGSKRYARSDSVVFREIAGEFLIVPLHSTAGEVDSVFLVNRTGARIWELLDGKRTLGDIGDLIAGESGIEPVMALEDVAGFVGALLEVGAAEEV